MRIRIIFGPVLIALSASIAFAQSPAVSAGSPATPRSGQASPGGTDDSDPESNAVVSPEV